MASHWLQKFYRPHFCPILLEKESNWYVIWGTIPSEVSFQKKNKVVRAGIIQKTLLFCMKIGFFSQKRFIEMPKFILFYGCACYLHKQIKFKEGWNLSNHCNKKYPTFMHFCQFPWLPVIKTHFLVICTTSDLQNRPYIKVDIISFQMMYVVALCMGCPKESLIPGLAAHLIGYTSIMKLRH